MPAKGVTSETLIERVATVIELVGAYPDQTIVVEISKKWGISKRQAWKYVKAAHRLFGQRLLEDRRHALELCLGNYQRIHQRALRDSNYSAAMEAMDKIVRLLRLHEFPIDDPHEGHSRAYTIEPNQRRTLREITGQIDDATRRRGIRAIEVIEAPKDLDIAQINAVLSPALIEDAEETEIVPEETPEPSDSPPKATLAEIFGQKQA
ncbi:MAG TPA: hypothetical protein PLY86_19385 [bacterium]|nr:hypothetical protein [bacterium]